MSNIFSTNIYILKIPFFKKKKGGAGVLPTKLQPHQNSHETHFQVMIDQLRITSLETRMELTQVHKFKPWSFIPFIPISSVNLAAEW